MTQPKIPGKFYPLTPEMMQRLRKANLSRHEMSLWLYLTELDPYGDRYQELPSAIQIMSELKMSKATYFRSKARLQELNFYDFQEEKVSFRNLTGVSFLRLQSHERDSDSQKRDLKSHERDSDSQKRDCESHERDFEGSEPAPSKASGTPQSYSDYSDFLRTLSEGEREDFYEFGRKKAAKLPHPPELPDKWVAANWEELKRQWKPAKPCRDFSQHPQRGEWLDKIRTLGAGAFLFEDGSRDQERSDFLDWADTSGLIWGQES